MLNAVWESMDQITNTLILNATIDFMLPATRFEEALL